MTARSEVNIGVGIQNVLIRMLGGSVTLSRSDILESARLTQVNAPEILSGERYLTKTVKDATVLGLAKEVEDLTALLDSLHAPTVEDDMALSLAGRVAALVARMKAVKS